MLLLLLFVPSHEGGAEKARNRRTNPVCIRVMLEAVEYLKQAAASSQQPTPQQEDDEFEPYVRRKRADGGSRKKMQGLNEQEQNMLRNSINSRERRRMHELNEEFESLRECLPYTNDSSSRRMSKANTLLLASNWIKHLTNANHILQNELTAARAQIAALKLTIEEKMSKKCSKCQQPACFSMSCLTSS